MTRPAYLLHRIMVCSWAKCELDEIYLIMMSHRRCIHCHKPLRPPTVGQTHPDSGD